MEEPTFNSRACAHVFVGVCLCSLVPLCICLCPFVQQLHFSTWYSGPAEICHRLTQKTKLRFTWHLTTEGLYETCDVQLLSRHVARRGVHLPQAWKSKWVLGAEVLSFDALAHEAVQRARDEFSLSEDVKLDCRPSQTKTCVRAHLRAFVHVNNHRYAGDLGFVPTRRNNLDYHCAIAINGTVREADVHVRTDHAA